MSILGRRRHSRYLLAHPMEGQLRVREEVAIEEWSDGEIVILSSEPCRSGERLTLELPGDFRHRLNVRVRESRAAIVADGAARHRLRLVIEHQGGADVSRGGRG